MSTLLSATLTFAQSTSPEALYDRAMDAITGVGSMQNDAEGVDYFRRSADVGYGPAQIALGYYYETGTVITKDQAQALTLYRKAALTGDPLAAWLTGRLYFLGNGTARDLDAAQKWLKMSAGQNNAYGAYYLARLMADRDATKAPALYKIAAEQGLPQAQYYYGKALKEGSGIAKDPLNAYIWLSIAADAGNNAASRDLLDISTAGSLTVDQISSAKTKARDMEQLVIRAVTARGCSGWDGEFDEMPTPPPPKLQRFCH
ncbi:MAG: tetratricopeptide repeat protein [Terriglobales bacterium]